MAPPHTLFPSRATRSGPKSTATTSRSLCQARGNQGARIDKNLTSHRVVSSSLSGEDVVRDFQRQRESIINQTNPSNAYDEEDMTSKRASYTRKQKLAAVGMAQTSYITLEDGSRNNRISELADIHYEENLEKWEKSSYSVGNRRIMLTKWVGQAWRELHAKQSGLIRRTFRKLGLSLAVDGSEDEEISIKDVPDIEVGDWRLTNPSDNDEQDVQEPESEGEEDKNGRAGVELEEKDNASRSRRELEYVMEDEVDEQHTGGNDGEDEGGDRNSDSELDSE